MEPPEEANIQPMPAMITLGAPYNNGGHDNYILREMSSPQRTIDILIKDDDFRKTLVRTTSSLRIDISPSIVNARHDIYDIPRRKSTHFSAAAEQLKAQYSELPGRPPIDVPELMFCGKHLVIPGEREADRFVLCEDVVKHAKARLALIRIPECAPSNELILKFASGKRLIVAMDYALFVCPTFKDSLKIENPDGAIGNVIHFKDVNHNTMKHIFLILYNPVSYFTDICSSIRICRNNRLLRILSVAKMLNITAIANIISANFKSSIKMYGIVIEYYFTARSSVIQRVEYAAAELLDGRQIHHNNPQDTKEQIRNLKEQIKKHTKRKNVSAKYELIGIEDLFGIINEFELHTLVSPFLKHIVRLNKLINDESANFRITGPVDTQMTIADFYYMMSNTRTNTVILAEIIKFMIEERKKTTKKNNNNNSMLPMHM